MAQASVTASVPPATATAAAAAPAKGAGTSKVVLVLVVLNLLAVAGVGGYVAYQARPRPAPAAVQEAALRARRAAAAAAAQTPPHRGPFIALDSIITNIVDAEDSHFLKVTVQLEAKDEAAAADVEAALVPIRDSVLLRLSSLTIAEMQGGAKKRALQEELLVMINAELRSRRVTHVYFTEFVVQ